MRLLVALVLGTALAGARPASAAAPVLGLADGPAAAQAGPALRLAVRDAGRRSLDRRALRRAGGRRLVREARACGLDAACLARLSRKRHVDPWIVRVDDAGGRSTFRLQGASHGRARAAVTLEGLAPNEVAAAVYGAVFHALGGRGHGRLTLGTVPAGAHVTAGGRALGRTPLRRVAIAAGALRIEAQASGYAAASRLVRVRPGEEVRLVLELEPDGTSIPLARLPAGGVTAGRSGEAPSARGEAVPEPEDGGEISPGEIPLASLMPEAAASAPPVDAAPAGTRAPADGEGPALATATPAKVAPEASAARADAGPAAPAEPGPSPRDARTAPSGLAADASRASAAEPAPNSAALSPASVAAGSPVPSDALAPPGPHGPRPTTWALLGGGVAAVAAAAFFGASASGTSALAHDPATAQTRVPGLNDEAATAATTANVLYGVGAAAIGVGSWLLTRDLTGP